VIELAADKRGKVVHRAALLLELLKSVPKERMHTNKKLTKIEETSSVNGGVTLHFEDGTQFEADAVAGADGIHGHVRSYILGEEHPALKPTFAGFWDCRALVPIEKARNVLGEQYFPVGEQRQYGWFGDGGFFMHDVLDGEATVQCIASVVAGEDWDEAQWKRQLDRKQLEEAFSTWKNSPVRDGMIEVRFNVVSTLPELLLTDKATSGEPRLESVLAMALHRYSNIRQGPNLCYRRRCPCIDTMARLRRRSSY
jgi:salicylate hydroxylase